MTIDPRLAAELRIQNPADVWAPKPAYTGEQTATGSDRSGFQRAVTQDGSVVRIESGKAQQATSADVSNAANAAARVPYVRAEDPVYRCAQSPDQVTDNSILTFPDGSQCTARDARNMGWLSSAPSTSAQPTPTNAAPTQPFNEGQEPPTEEVHPDLQVNLLADEAIDRDYSDLVDNTGGIEQHNAIKQIVQNGAIDAGTMGTLASQLRVEPAQLAARVAPIMQAMETQAREVMSEGGLDSSEVVAYAQQHSPDKLRLAMNKQATMRQTSGYADIRQDFLESLGEANPERALTADLGPGITSYKDAKGKVMVRIPGMGDMLWKTAIKAFG